MLSGIPDCLQEGLADESAFIGQLLTFLPGGKHGIEVRLPALKDLGQQLCRPLPALLHTARDPHITVVQQRKHFHGIGLGLFLIAGMDGIPQDRSVLQIRLRQLAGRSEIGIAPDLPVLRLHNIETDLIPFGDAQIPFGIFQQSTQKVLFREALDAYGQILRHAVPFGDAHGDIIHMIRIPALVQEQHGAGLLKRLVHLMFSQRIHLADVFAQKGLIVILEQLILLFLHLPDAQHCAGVETSIVVMDSIAGTAPRCKDLQQESLLVIDVAVGEDAVRLLHSGPSLHDSAHNGIHGEQRKILI